MKTKMTVPVLVLAVAIAATVVAANLFGSARTIPMPNYGDPIPGIGVSIEQSPGGITKGSDTNGDGISSITVNPGRVVATFKIGGAKRIRFEGKANVNGISTGGGKPASGTWSKLDEPFKLEMAVKGRGPQTVTFKVTEGK